jgi:hypothetical protein
LITRKVFRWTLVASRLMSRRSLTPGFQPAATKIKAAVPGLQGLGANPNYVLVGSPASNDPCSSTKSQHIENHFGTVALNQMIVNIATHVRNVTGVRLRVNDMSLETGGLFDFENTWQPPHFGHRRGQEVDIGFRGLTAGGACFDFNVSQLRKLIRQITGVFPPVEGDHYHVRVP